MNNIRDLKYRGKTYTSNQQIYSMLKEKEFYWLIDSETVNASIEIDHDTIIWHDGIFLNGTWKYGIFLDGEFYGIWENGIFENGVFKGKWISGIMNAKK